MWAARHCGVNELPGLHPGRWGHPEVRDRSSEGSLPASHTKLALTEFESDLTNFSLDVLGAAGMTQSATATEFLYPPGVRVAGLTSEIQRNLIGERLLGLPREPRH